MKRKKVYTSDETTLSFCSVKSTILKTSEIRRPTKVNVRDQIKSGGCTLSLRSGIKTVTGKKIGNPLKFYLFRSGLHWTYSCMHIMWNS